MGMVLHITVGFMAIVELKWRIIRYIINNYNLHCYRIRSSTNFFPFSEMAWISSWGDVSETSGINLFQWERKLNTTWMLLRCVFLNIVSKPPSTWHSSHYYIKNCCWCWKYYLIKKYGLMFQFNFVVVRSQRHDKYGWPVWTVYESRKCVLAKPGIFWSNSCYWWFSGYAINSFCTANFIQKN